MNILTGNINTELNVIGQMNCLRIMCKVQSSNKKKIKNQNRLPVKTIDGHGTALNGDRNQPEACVGHSCKWRQEPARSMCGAQL